MGQKYKRKAIGKYEFGYDEFLVFKEKRHFHAAKRYAIRQIEYMVLSKSEIEKKRIFYNLKHYYGMKKNKFDKVDTKVSGIMVPLLMGLVATYPTIYMAVYERIDIIKLLIMYAVLIVIVEVSALKYLNNFTDRKQYYDFYFEVICEYIENEKFS